MAHCEVNSIMLHAILHRIALLFLPYEVLVMPIGSLVKAGRVER